MKEPEYFILFLPIIIIILNITTVSGCDLPWTGEWLDNDRPFNISRKEMAHLGSCKERKNDEFLLESNAEGRGICHRCLLVFPVHKNVLQYKATKCIFHDAMTIDRCRMHYTGDLPVNTLFRNDAPSVRCPLEYPLKFVYQDNLGSCSSRSSTIDRCAQNDRLTVNFEACPENPKREARVSEVECIGHWSSMGMNFFAARVIDRRGESYRCFIQDSSGSSGTIGISADSGCQELTHIGAATTTLHYRQEAKIQSDCDFPLFLWKHEGRKYRGKWTSTVDGRHHKVFKGNWVSQYRSSNDTEWTCLERKDKDHAHIYKTLVRRGCTVGYQCLKLKRAKKHILHISYGSITQNEFDDCLDMVAETRNTIIMPDGREPCPVHGRLIAPGCESHVVSIGCKRDLVEIAQDCDSNKTNFYTCVGHYEIHQKHTVILKNEQTDRYQCMTYSSSEKSLKLFDHVSCHSDSLDAMLPAYNLKISNEGRCETSLLAGFLSSSSASQTTAKISLLLILLKLLF